MFLLGETEIECTENPKKFIAELNRESIVTRYPEDIRRIGKNYNKKNTKETIANSGEALKWLREKL